MEIRVPFVGKSIILFQRTEGTATHFPLIVVGNHRYHTLIVDITSIYNGQSYAEVYFQFRRG
jgi:hypothetical protein